MMQRVKGSFTVEAAVIVPLIMVVFGVVLTLLFYYHDKNILASTAYETAVYGAGHPEESEAELAVYLQGRAEDKLLLFSAIEGVVTREEEQVHIVCRARKKKMTLKAESRIALTDPEEYIRNIRKIEKIKNGVGGT